MLAGYQEVAGRPAVQLPGPWSAAAVTVVLPTYNEAANLPVIVDALFGLALTGLRMVVVDDNSPDGTGAVAEELAVRHGRDRMSVVHRPGKQGLGRAYVDGMSRAIRGGAEYVVQMDSDLSHRPEYLPQMLGALLSSNADVVIGSRYIAGASLGQRWPWHRRLLSGFANAYARAFLRPGIRDMTAGFKLWRSAALHDLDLPSVQSKGYSVQVELSHRAVRRGLKVLEVPIHFADRAAGRSKLNLRVQLESALMPVRLRLGRRGRPPSHGRTSLAVGQCCEFAVPQVPPPRSKHRASHRKTEVNSSL
ncbi:MAG TPA: polyprenol monophosphomannose synthase [Streptosporangiaceae bacterium]|jgi:dolichol-phosphate mannosyltransferase